ncbi:hypothetical protein HYDPIDRAFT_30336 [Hydnomerulius pinastri MD-312]|uniref:Unplaced genomic scaffold scaffold_20, whole genome shotgun sequence n=1 Tax=Hydnomerulius pinastri MD-312 TaxID=994086 RepID=A0A0C9WD52_9AGAM|nr:hypothetical protein HYDPIDRAFT_30336 [Hydnomerulius pinastri MD-312]
MQSGIVFFAHRRKPTASPPFPSRSPQRHRAILGLGLYGKRFPPQIWRPGPPTCTGPFPLHLPQYPNVCINTTQGNVYTAHIVEATQARANLRGVLKGSKRTESGNKDYLRIIKVLDDYIPQLYGIMACCVW